MPTVRVSRRHLLKGVATTTAGVAAFPWPLRAQAKTIKVGVVSPITGAMAEVGGDCRLGAQLAAEAINVGRPIVTEDSRLAKALRSAAAELVSTGKSDDQPAAGMLGRLAWRRA